MIVDCTCCTSHQPYSLPPVAKRPFSCEIIFDGLRKRQQNVISLSVLKNWSRIDCIVDFQRNRMSSMHMCIFRFSMEYGPQAWVLQNTSPKIKYDVNLCHKKPWILILGAEKTRYSFCFVPLGEVTPLTSFSFFLSVVSCFIFNFLGYAHEEQSSFSLPRSLLIRSDQNREATAPFPFISFEDRGSNIGDTHTALSRHTV